MGILNRKGRNENQFLLEWCYEIKKVVANILQFTLCQTYIIYDWIFPRDINESIRRRTIKNQNVKGTKIREQQYNLRLIRSVSLLYSISCFLRSIVIDLMIISLRDTILWHRYHSSNIYFPWLIRLFVLYAQLDLLVALIDSMKDLFNEWLRRSSWSDHGVGWTSSRWSYRYLSSSSSSCCCSSMPPPSSSSSSSSSSLSSSHRIFCVIVIFLLLFACFIFIFFVILVYIFNIANMSG